METNVQEAWPLDLVKRQQDSCPILSQIKSLQVSKETPPEVVDENQDKDLKFFYKEIPNLSVREDGILRHVGTENSETGQIVIPRSLTSRVLQMMHDDFGHFGTAKTSARVRERFFWPSMSLEVDDWCRNCFPCQKRKNSPPRRTGDNGYCRISIEVPRISLLFGHG